MRKFVAYNWKSW